jgi:colanic acid/amylovoran biosynthesis glycosyltransferase
MKVVFFVDSFPKLSETFILQQITTLIDSGFDVRIVAQTKGPDSEMQPVVEAYNLMKKVTFIPIIKNPLKLLAKSVPFYIRRVTKLYGYDFLSKYNLLMLAYVPFLSELNLDRNDVVVCNFGPNGIKAANLARFGKDFKQITIFHGYDLSSFIKSSSKNVYREVFKQSDSVLSISNFWKERLVELGCPEDKLLVYRMGIDLNEFKPSTKKEDKFTFISTGRMVEKKGFEYSIRAFARISQQLEKDVEYVIIGDGPMMKDLERLTESLGVNQQVHLVGSKSADEVKALLQGSDVYVLPSVIASNGDMEGIPVSMLEAEATGIPVIATNHSGVSEGMIEGLTGFLINEKDVAGLARVLLTVAQTKREDLQKMGTQARKLIETQYNKNLQGVELVRIIKSL